MYELYWLHFDKFKPSKPTTEQEVHSVNVILHHAQCFHQDADS